MSSVTPVNKSTYFSQGCEADDDVEDQSYHQKAEPDTVSQETQENTQVSLPICWHFITCHKGRLFQISVFIFSCGMSRKLRV